MNAKEVIIRKSFMLFLVKEYKEVSLNEILEECGASKGVFYHYYKSKDELYITVLDRFFFSYFNKQDVDYSNNTIKIKVIHLVDTFLKPYREVATILGQKHLSAYFRFLFQDVNTLSC